ncbi:hypothetical protein [Cellulophaga omnivescoria]|uniref:hypothetical protein n=1 Tax=Cellulophaga omnivescoria TaxID=1888890 RepID=UPI0022F06635|nr:hypothetical protein [Cellulophaga omnivescoria]WBU90980.1 hypothetical protein PBN93_08145 [Cellulophaga omnivescoria]WKB79835.1 hypothetical protein QYR09_08730 [Cellulophaga lytica]
MKKISLLIAVLGIITTNTVAQQKNRFKIDSTLNNKSINKSFISLYKKNNSDTFSKFKENNLLKYKQIDFKNTVPFKQKETFTSTMPIHKPKGKFNARNIKIDTTYNYSLKIIRL